MKNSVFSLLLAGLTTALATAEPSLRFSETADGGFQFDTGLLRGQLHASGKSLGLTHVIHIPSGKRLDRSNGLLSHYRVFTKGVRYGGGAWDWPSRAHLLADGGVEVQWPGTAERPFSMRAVYRWHSSNSVDLETIVTADKDLVGFESFLANYFSESFTNAVVWAKASTGSDSAGKAGFVRLGKAAGDWQMFPRDQSVLRLIRDGRWELQPNPVNWTIRPPFAEVLACRAESPSGLAAALMSSAGDCFAIASPEETEGHYSLYFSLFGRDLRAGETATAKTRLVIVGDGFDGVFRAYEAFRPELR